MSGTYCAGLGSLAVKKCLPSLDPESWISALGSTTHKGGAGYSHKQVYGACHWVQFPPSSGVEFWCLHDSWSMMVISATRDRSEAGPRLPWAAGWLTSTDLASQELPSVARK